MRIKGLDFLRGIAVILVIFRHASSGNIIANIGWIGVDLFFVLSGFLISGLIFKEYFKTNSFDITRFLIKRAFKIYPSFYFFILTTVFVNYLQTNSFYNIHIILNEIFYLQSYRDSIWGHTWSLAVEEHFYIAIAVFSFFAVNTELSVKNRFIGYALVFLLILSFIMRFYVSYEHKESPTFLFSETHLRMDGILVGILISYLYYFTKFYKLFIEHKFLFLSIAFLLISPAFFYLGGSYFNNTIGFSTINVGFGILVLFSLTDIHYNNKIIAFVAKQTLTVICFVGVHSYSIYLWHMMSEKLVRLIAGERQYDGVQFIMVLSTSLIIGVAMSYIIERPFLKLRDKIYTQKQNVT